MKLHRAGTKETAIRVEYKTMESHKIDQVANQFIDEVFGANDGDYMILNQSTHPTPSGKKYRIYLVEDGDKQLHEVYFELVEIKSGKTNSFL